MSCPYAAFVNILISQVRSKCWIIDQVRSALADSVKHCKNLTPEFSKAAQSLHPLIPFYAIDCDAAPNKALCSEYSIKGFPTIKVEPTRCANKLADFVHRPSRKLQKARRENTKAKGNPTRS